MEDKYFILNQDGKCVRVSKEEYEQYINEHPEMVHTESPKFQTPDQQEARKNVIDNVIESLNNDKLTDNEMYKIEEGVKTKDEEDIEKENRERLNDDLSSFQTSQQQESIEGKDSKIQNIITMLNQLNLSEGEMARIESKVQRVDNETEKSDEEKTNEEKKDER